MTQFSCYVKFKNYFAAPIALSRALKPTRFLQTVGFFLGCIAVSANSAKAGPAGMRGIKVWENTSNPKENYYQDVFAACKAIGTEDNYKLVQLNFAGNPSLPLRGYSVTIFMGSSSRQFACEYSDRLGDRYLVTGSMLEYCEPSYTYVRGICSKYDDDGKKDSCGTSPQVGNPYSVNTGEKIEVATDIGGNWLNWSLTRHYASRSESSKIFGRSKWKYSFEYQLVETPIFLTVIDPLGQEYRFKRNVSSDQTYEKVSVDSGIELKRGRFSYDPNDANTSYNPQYDGVRFKAESGDEVFFEDSDLQRQKGESEIQRINYKNGTILLKRYESIIIRSGGTESIINLSIDRTTDGFNSSLSYPNKLTYAEIRLLASSQNPDYVLEYAYNDSYQLTEVTTKLLSKDGKVINRIKYLYEDANFPFLLTGVIDFRGVRVSTWTYDNLGRVLSSSKAGGSEKFSIAYNDANFSRTVTNPLGKTAVYTFQNYNSRLSLTSVSGSSSANCPASITSISYDSAGRIEKTVDEEGRQVQYQRDSSGRINKITRGSP